MKSESEIINLLLHAIAVASEYNELSLSEEMLLKTWLHQYVESKKSVINRPANDPNYYNPDTYPDIVD